MVSLWPCRTVQVVLIIMLFFAVSMAGVVSDSHVLATLCVYGLFFCVCMCGGSFLCVWPLCVYVWCLFLCVCGHFVCVYDCGGSLFVCVTTFSALFSYFSSHEVCTFFLVLILVFSSNAA